MVASSSLTVVAAFALTACTGANLDGGLAATGFDAPSLASVDDDAGETTLSLAAAPIRDAASDGENARTAVPEPAIADAAPAAEADDERSTTIAKALTTARSGPPVPPLPLADAPDTDARASVPPTVLALAPSKPKRRLSFAALGARAERLDAPSRATAAKRRVEVARTTRIIKPRKAGDALPGVRSRSSLFRIGRATPNEAAKAFTVASAAGLARLSENGFRKQTAHVKTECFVPRLVQTLRYVEKHYGKPVVVTSGYRSPRGNQRAGGAKGSKHVSCEAADFQVEGVSKWELAKLLRSLPGRGGVGTYCHTKSVHYDVGSKRDWNWGCRKRR